MQAARDEAASSVGNLALVPLADPQTALSIRTNEMEEAVKGVRLQMRAHAWNERKEDERRAFAIMHWQSSEGEEKVTEMCGVLPGLDRQILSMVGVPAFSKMSWTRLSLAAEELIPRVLALPRTEDVRLVLEDVAKRWLRLHRQVQHGDQTPLPYAPKMKKRDKPKPSCFDAKHCLCGKDGDELWALYLKVLSVLRRQMLVHAFKENLRTAYIVIHLMPLKSEQVEHIRGGDVDFAATTPNFVSDGGFAAVVLLYESPLRPTMRYESSLGDNKNNRNDIP